jgi:hypothetical protein
MPTHVEYEYYTEYHHGPINRSINHVEYEYCTSYHHGINQ